MVEREFLEFEPFCTIFFSLGLFLLRKVEKETETETEKLCFALSRPALSTVSSRTKKEFGLRRERLSGIALCSGRKRSQDLIMGSFFNLQEAR